VERYVFTIPLSECKEYPKDSRDPSKCNDMHLWPKTYIRLHSQGTDPSLLYTACHSRPASFLYTNHNATAWQRSSPCTRVSAVCDKSLHATSRCTRLYSLPHCVLGILYITVSV
jgi:hypothetical protein